MGNTKERVVRVIAGVLGLNDAETAELRKDVGYRQFGQWTSSRHAEIIVALEDEFGIEVESRMIAKLNDVPKIVGYIENLA